MGAHLFECAGNNNPANFGLMSVAEWDGVPLTDVLSRLERDAARDGGARERCRSRRALHPAARPPGRAG